MIDGFIKFLHAYGISVGWTLLIMGGVIFLVSINVTNTSLDRMIAFMVATSPVWLPIVLFFTFFERWLMYIQKRFKLKNGRVTLEIMIPEEIYKSPEAMEIILTQLHQKASPDNLMETYLDGKHPPTFGLEIVSTGGRVHLYINTPRVKFKNIAETQLYAQYPGIEIRELPVDYTAEIAKGDDTWSTFTLHFGLKNKDVYPIKTYVDYKLNEMPKEEEKNDPITPIIDLLGSISKDERLWYQFLITAHRDVNFKVGYLRSKSDWKPDIDKEIEAILDNARKRGGVGDDEKATITQLTEGERQKISSLERNRAKFSFDTKVRVIYAGKGDAYQPGERIGAIISSFFQVNDANLNGIGMHWRTDFDYKIWSDPKGKRIAHMKKKTLDHYKRRFFEPMDHNDKTAIMTTEELATLFHLPGKVELSPNLERIPSTRGEAPPNLPTG